MKFLVVNLLMAACMASLVNSAPAGFVLPTHGAAHVYIDHDDHSLEDIHDDSLEDHFERLGYLAHPLGWHDDSLEDHLDRLRYMKHPHDEILDRHLDRVEDILEDHYGVDLDNLFEDDHHRLRLKYVVKPGGVLASPAIIRKYFTRPAITYSSKSHVALPLPPTATATASPTTKKVLVDDTKAVVSTSGSTVSVGAASSTADPAIPPEVVKKIVDEEVKDAVEDIAEDPHINIEAKAKEVEKEIEEEKREFKEDVAKGTVDKDDLRPIRTT